MGTYSYLVDCGYKEYIFLNDGQDQTANLQAVIVVLLSGPLRPVEEPSEKHVVLLREDVSLLAEVVAVYHVLDSAALLKCEWHDWACNGDEHESLVMVSALFCNEYKYIVSGN